MQLRFQTTPVNLNAQEDRNNNKLHKFKIDKTCSGACLRITLDQCGGAVLGFPAIPFAGGEG